MRDVLLLLILGAATFYTLRQPWIGVLVWTNISLMSPHVTFGYRIASWPVSTGVALATLGGLVATRQRHNPMIGAPMWMLLLFSVWITVTLPTSLYFDDSLPLWIRSMKIFLMLFVTAALIDDRSKLDAFIWVNVISIGFYGVKGGIFTIVTGGNYRVWGPGGFIEGNNEVALAVITLIPLMRYLQMGMTNRWHRRGMAVAMALCAVTALGSYSRGALLALGAMAALLWWKSPGKVRWAALLLVVGLAALSVMPEQWWQRMDTIYAYEQDSSAMGRVNAWWNAWNLARDRPLGGGFMIYTPEVFARYSPDPSSVHAAHSIYFQILGEHGFIGLAIFLSMGIGTWITCVRLIAAGRRDPRHARAAQLGAMVQVSVLGFGTGGAFLSLAYFDLPYNVMLMVVLAHKFVRQDNVLPRVGLPPANGRPAESALPARMT